MFSSSYQLQLQLNSVTVSALKHILNNDFLKDIKIFRSFLLDHNIIFSSKAIDFKKNAFNFDFKNFFFFFFDERETCLQNILINYFTKDFSADDLIVIEMNISSYNMSKRDELSSFIKYKLLLCAIFFLEHDFNVFNKSSSKTLKYSEENLMSSRKNKKTDDIVFFFDEN